ncbi:hypothetical protein ACWEVD_09675 [Nocardia thailandica]|uniref:Uncharacterized protein n=1 Tax=Nocardia thailandica TaxID=257275 RepID=A0ABW6PIP2_9NOCA|nr:hypothetical protein [Nocardia thailandica]
MTQRSILGWKRTPRDLHSRETATQFVIDRVERTGAATQHDFDIDLIVTAAHDQTGDWDLRALPEPAFWRIAATCFKD